MESVSVPDRVRIETVRKMQEVIDAGRCVAIIGWINSNHDSFTSKLDLKWVRFLDNEARSLPTQKTGYVLFTRFVGHPVQRKIRKLRIPDCSFILSNGVIKGMLRDLNFPARVQPSRSLDPSPQSTVETMEEDLTLNTLVNTADANEARSVMSKSEAERSFAIAFISAVGGDSGKMLSKYQVSELIREHLLTDRPPSHLKNWLEGVVLEGNSRAGQYRATPALVALAGQPEKAEPTDPIEKARWLVSREPVLHGKAAGLQAEISRLTSHLESELEKIRREIARCRKAKELLERLTLNLKDL